MSAVHFSGSVASGVWDFVDYQAMAGSIEPPEVESLLTLPKFRVAVATYGDSLIPLGYAAFFSWQDARAALPGITPAKLMDVVRYVALRRRLPTSDARHVAIDADPECGQFPLLFERTNSAAPEVRKATHEQFTQAMGDFASTHPWRYKYSTILRLLEEAKYAEYWAKSSQDRIQTLLKDRRFLAALDAYHEGALSYGGLLEKVYGDPGHLLFPDIGRHLCGLVLVEMAKAIDRGEIKIPEGLRSEFPELYEFYNPEAFGKA